MKLYKLLIKSFISLWCLYFFECVSIKIKQAPLPDNQYRQANVPPVLAVIFDVPEYSKDDLYKWTDFINSNTMLMAKNKLKNEEIKNESYSKRLKRIGTIKATIK